MKDQLTQSEAVYAFAGWITSRDEVVHTGDPGLIADLVAHFCKAQGFDKPRDDFPMHIVPTPKYPPEEK